MTSPTLAVSAVFPPISAVQVNFPVITVTLQIVKLELA